MTIIKTIFNVILQILVGFLILAAMIEGSQPVSLAEQQTVVALWSIKYILYAIFFELVAIGWCRK